ncbi:MAG: DNA cytosine methyltransferase [Deltaproteobacteria bacterium]|nr:DNA cytosine methyltransferase [Deltaproteobacteria bacterium]
MNSSKTKQRPLAIDLFAGAGGMSLGFEQAGFDIVAAVELDPIHCAAHEFNFPYSATICADISKLTGEEIRRRANLSNEHIDVVFGGPPCQGFSMIGKRTLDDPRNSLMMQFIRIVCELRPKIFVLENVAGLTVGKHIKFLKEIYSAFEAKGYQVRSPYRILNASSFGVPQDRRRVIILGALNGQQLPKYPTETTHPFGKTTTTKLPLFEERSTPSVWDALCDLPNIEDNDDLFDSDCCKAKFGEPSTYSALLRGLSRAMDDFSYPRKHDPDLLTSSMRTEHTAESIARFKRTKGGTTEPVSRFFKLAKDGLCNTLRAGTASDRGAYTSPRPIHPVFPRCITVREAARIHSYPDWFRFHRTKWHGMRQIGNSVPPLLARAVGACVRRALGAKPIMPTKEIDLGNPRLLEFTMTQAAEHFDVPADVIPPRERLVVNA